MSRQRSTTAVASHNMMAGGPSRPVASIAIPMPVKISTNKATGAPRPGLEVSKPAVQVCSLSPMRATRSFPKPFA
eukprot:scaffold435794_cov46-Prasinocladus_malaysianus.AAC.1